jgi:hypothetical protein
MGAITLGVGYYPIYQGMTYDFRSAVDFITDISLIENSICAWGRVARGGNAVVFLFSHWLWKLFILFCIYQDRYVKEQAWSIAVLMLRITGNSGFQLP